MADATSTEGMLRRLLAAAWAEIEELTEQARESKDAALEWHDAAQRSSRKARVMRDSRDKAVGILQSIAADLRVESHSVSCGAAIGAVNPCSCWVSDLQRYLEGVDA